MDKTTIIKKLDLLMPRPGLCQECATKHEPGEPHNAKSLFYQMRFFTRENRWPTWLDAMSHCEKEIQDEWIIELIKAGELKESDERGHNVHNE